VAISTYSDLRGAVADFMQRTDLTAAIPTFVELATGRFSDELRTPEMEEIAQTTITGAWTALPSDFRAVRLVEADDAVLEYRTPWQVQRLIDASNNPIPPVYTIQDLSLRIHPAPTGSVVKLTYYAALDALVNSGDANWLLTKRPDVYLQASLFYGWQYVNDMQRMAAALAYVDKYIAEANRSARRIMIGSAPLAVRAA
jgi:hypothetical protein